MDGRRARFITRPLDRLPRIPEATPATPAVTRPGDRLTRGWSLLLGLGWPVVFQIALVLEPTAADPNAAPPLLAELASFGLLAALVVTAVAAASRHRAAAVGGVVAGLVSVAMSVTCPVSGHHAYGLWWVAQLGLLTAMLAVSVVALGHRSRAAA